MINAYSGSQSPIQTLKVDKEKDIFGRLNNSNALTTNLRNI